MYVADMVLGKACTATEWSGRARSRTLAMTALVGPPEWLSLPPIMRPTPASSRPSSKPPTSRRGSRGRSAVRPVASRGVGRGRIMLDLSVELHEVEAQADFEGYARLVAAIILRAEGAAGSVALSEAA